MQTVKMLPHQGLYLQAPYLFPEVTYFLLVCGYGAGKTRANVFAALHAIKRLQGKKDQAGDYARIIVAGYTLSHLNKTFLLYLRQMLNNSKTPYMENKKDNYLIIGTVTVLIIPIENPETIFGMESAAIFVEELDELTEDKALEAVRALTERRRQQIIGERSPYICFASTSQGQKGLYRLYTHFKKTQTGFVLLRGRTQDNVYLPKGQIADLYRIYTPEERRVFLDGEFLSIAKGRVLGDFDWERNYVDEDLDLGMVPGETVLIAQDFNAGYNRAAAAVVRDGAIYIVKRYDFPDPQDAPSVFRHDFPTQRILWIPDVTIKDSFPQYARELRRHHIQIIYRRKNPLVEDTCFLVNKLLYVSRLFFCRMAKDAAEACALAMRDKDGKIPKGIGPGYPIHDIDCIRYICSFVASRDPAFRDIRRLIMEKRASFRTDSDETVHDLGDGYMQIHPDALRSRKIS
jgi:hypothetical protein